MRDLGASVLVLVLASGCGHHYPEGVYPCAADRDCPPAWLCHADNLCYSPPEGDGGRPDAGADAASDAPMRDTGPTCGAETCNGTDDDCDGLIDEGVMTVGPAVVLDVSDPTLAPLQLVPTAMGYGATAISDTVLSTWLRTDALGAPITTAQPPQLADLLALDAATDADATFVLAVRPGGTPAVSVLGFDSASGAPSRIVSPYTLVGPGANAGAGRLTGASRTRVTAYLAYLPPGGGSARLARHRLETTRDPLRTLVAADIALDLGDQRAFAVLSTTSDDFVAYRRDDGRIVLLAGPSDDSSAAFRMLGVIGTAGAPRADFLSLGVHDPSAPISPANPLGIAWLGRNDGSSGRQTLAFAEITSTASTQTTPTTFSDAYGAWGGFFTDRAVQLVALPDVANHWLLINQDTESESSPSGARLQVRELIGPATTIRRITVPDEPVGPQANIVAAQTPGALRVLESAGTGGLVTRSIGCE